ncbi:hypothetical protein ACB087_09395 [Vibrio sp. VNB-15]
MIDVDWAHGIAIFIISTIAMLLFGFVIWLQRRRVTAQLATAH